jgi:hypothetical protein
MAQEELIPQLITYKGFSNQVFVAVSGSNRIKDKTELTV